MPSEAQMLKAIRELEALENEAATKTAALVQELAPNIERRQHLRQFILAQTFGTRPKEGKTQVDCPGYRLVCEQAVTRTVDEPVLLASKAKFVSLDIPIDQLIRIKRELAVKEYRKLTPKQTRIFDTALIIKPAPARLTLIPFAPL